MYFKYIFMEMEMTSAAPYRSSPAFDERSLPEALRHRHATKEGVWGVIRILEGRARLVWPDSGTETILDENTPGLILPGQPHFVEPLEAVKLQIDFHDRPPEHPAGR